MECGCGTIKRVCRSTLAAESNAVVEALESAEWLRALLYETLFREATPRNLRRGMRDTSWVIPSRVYSDSRSLIDVIYKDTGYPVDKRVRIVVAQLRQSAQDPGVSSSWVDTKLQPSDGPTKVGVERGYLLDILQYGV